VDILVTRLAGISLTADNLDALLSAAKVLAGNELLSDTQAGALAAAVFANAAQATTDFDSFSTLTSTLNSLKQYTVL